MKTLILLNYQSGKVLIHHYTSFDMDDYDGIEHYIESFLKIALPDIHYICLDTLVIETI